MTKPISRDLARGGMAALMATLMLAGACKKQTPTSPTTTTPAAAAGPVITTLNPASDAAADARTSQKASGGLPAQVFDDFTSATGATITSAQWYGIYCVPVVNAPAPAPTATSFLVAFYPDKNNAPDTTVALSNGTYNVGPVSQTLVQTNTTATCGTATPTSIPIYSYSVTLSPPFVAAAGVKYWFSVQANTPDFSTSWGWRNGVANNNYSLQIFNGVTTTFNTDRAFALLQ